VERRISDLSAEITELKRLIDEHSEGASDEWLGAAHRALRAAEERLRAALGDEDRAERSLEMRAL
jgi:hypothetical protein